MVLVITALTDKYNVHCEFEEESSLPLPPHPQGGEHAITQETESTQDQGQQMQQVGTGALLFHYLLVFSLLSP